MQNQPSDAAFRDVRLRGFRGRADVEDVLALMESRLKPLSAEEVALHEATARVLANEIVAPCDVPGFET